MTHDANSRIAVLEEKVENLEKILIEKLRESDRVRDILEEIRSKQTRSNGFMAGVAAAVSLIWSIIIMAFDKIAGHVSH